MSRGVFSIYSKRAKESVGFPFSFETKIKEEKLDLPENVKICNWALGSSWWRKKAHGGPGVLSSLRGSESGHHGGEDWMNFEYRSVIFLPVYREFP